MAEKEDKKEDLKSLISHADEFFKRGELDKGTNAYMRIAEHLERHGKSRHAREVYKRGAEILKKAGEYDLAAELYRKAGDYNNLAGVYLEAALNSREHEDKKKYAGRASEIYHRLHKTTREMAGISGRLEEKIHKHEKHKIAAAGLLSLGFLLAILSVSSQITGFAVAEKTSNVSAFGALFFVLGIIFMLIYLKRKLKH